MSAVAKVADAVFCTRQVRDQLDHWDHSLRAADNFLRGDFEEQRDIGKAIVADIGKDVRAVLDNVAELVARLETAPTAGPVSKAVAPKRVVRRKTKRGAR